MTAPTAITEQFKCNWTWRHWNTKRKHPSTAETSTGEKFAKKMNNANCTISTCLNSPRTIWPLTLFVKLLYVLATKKQSSLNPNVKAGTKQASPSSFRKSKKNTDCNINYTTKPILPMKTLPTSNSNSNKSTSVIMTSLNWPKHAGIAGYVPTYTTCVSTHALHGKISTFLLAAKLHTTNQHQHGHEAQ